MGNGKKTIRTHTDIAAKYGTTRQTVSEWAKRPDWPKKQGDRYDGRKIDAFLRRHKIGPYRSRDETLTQARLKYLQSRTIEQNLRNIDQEIRTQLELGRVLLAEDVEAFYRQTVSVVGAILDELEDRFDRGLPVSPPAADAWPDLRVRLLETCRRVAGDGREMISELLAKPAEDEEG